MKHNINFCQYGYEFIVLHTYTTYVCNKYYMYLITFTLLITFNTHTVYAYVS